MLVKNVLSKISTWFRSLRFSWLYSRDTSCLLIPIPIVFCCYQGIVFGFMFLWWQIGFQFTREV